MASIAWNRGAVFIVRLAYATLPQPDPDAVRGGTWEAFQRVLAEAGCEAPKTKQK